jgi:F0F1-type ATP synthase assembly protein I
MSLRKTVLATQNRAFAIVLLGVAAVWRLVLIFDQRLLQRGRITPAVFLFMWGLLPYAMAAGLSRRLSRRALLLLSGVLLSTDFVAGTGAIRPGVSTDPVALLTQPVFGILVVVVGFGLGRVVRAERKGVHLGANRSAGPAQRHTSPEE